MLDSFRHLDRAVLQPQGRRLTEWLFLEVSDRMNPFINALYNRIGKHNLE